MDVKFGFLPKKYKNSFWEKRVGSSKGEILVYLGKEKREEESLVWKLNLVEFGLLENWVLFGGLGFWTFSSVSFNPYTQKNMQLLTRVWKLVLSVGF